MCGSTYDVTQAATQSLEELETIVLVYKSNLYKNGNSALEANQSPPILFTNLKTPPSHLKRLADIVFFKNLNLRNESPSWRNLHFPCAFEM